MPLIIILQYFYIILKTIINKKLLKIKIFKSIQHTDEYQYNIIIYTYYVYNKL